MCMKKIKILGIICCFLILTGCQKKDNILFKEEYESLNTNSNYRSVTIPKDNKMVYITDEELLTKIENKEDLVVYFGFSKCPWCRSIIETLIQVSKDLDMDKIYYLDISSIRDIKEIQDNRVITIKQGSQAYLKIVKLLNDYLADYQIDNQVVGKRIYAPNILVIKNQQIKGIETGVSSLQTDYNQELTLEIKKDMTEKITNLLKQYQTATCNHGAC